MGRKHRRKKILEEINNIKINIFFLFGVVWLTLFGIFSISSSVSQKGEVQGANTQIYTKIDDTYFKNFVSKSLELELLYDTRVFNLVEKDGYISISSVNKKIPIQNSSMRISKENDITKIFPKLNLVDTSKYGDINISLFTYIKPSFPNNQETNIDYLSVIYKQVTDGKFVYLPLWGYDYERNSKTTDLLVELFDSITIVSQGKNNSGVLSATSSSINKAQILGQTSTVRIYSKECNNVKFSNEMSHLRVQGKTYEVCSAGFGSGFVINSNGHVVTNAHIANPNNLDSLIEGYSTDGTFEKDFLADVMDYLVSEFDTATLAQATEEDMIYFVTALITDLNKQGYITITDKDKEIYIQGETIFKNNPESGELLEKDKYFKANLIQSTPLTSFYESLLSDDTAITEVADLAVLQVEGNFNLPSIPINTTGFSIGQTIYVVGYPQIADDAELISSTQVLSSSVTKGSISSIKPNTNNTFDLVQIDAAIQGGNSGGPIIDEDGNVVAVATYSISSDSGNYNYGVSSKELLTFLANSSVEPQINPMRVELEKSLSDVSLSYYKRAQKSLEDILFTQPNLTVTLKPVLDLCKDKVDAGEDKTPLLNINNRILMIIVLIVLVVLLAISLIFLIINIKKISGKKKELSQIPKLINQ
jgi:hypothetical protein